MNKLILSFKKNKVGIFIIIFSAICTSIGQYLWKIWEREGVLVLIFGFLLYGIGAIAMIIAFRFGSLSVLHPMMSIGYVFALFIGFFLLDEKITFLKVCGIITILIGVTLIGIGDE